MGTLFRDWLKQTTLGANSNSDLVSLFFRQVFELLRSNGTLGLISTKTIRQGDTRLTGLKWICDNGGVIYNAQRRKSWPGVAAVIVSVVHIQKLAIASLRTAFILDGKEVPKITGFLFHTGGNDNPFQLNENSGKSFIGCFVRGMGFTFDDLKEEASPLQEMNRLVEKNSENAERIFPYIGGDEVNSSPTHSHHRFAINFEEMPLRRDGDLSSWQSSTSLERRDMLRDGIVPSDFDGPVASDWPDLLEIVKRKVRPGRNKLKDSGVDAGHKKKWWLYANSRPELQRAIAGLDEVLMVGRNADRMGFTFLPTGMVYSDQAVIFPLGTYAAYCCCQSRSHEEWVRFFASSMKDDLRYSPTDAFETFPFPSHVVAHSLRSRRSSWALV